MGEHSDSAILPFLLSTYFWVPWALVFFDPWEVLAMAPLHVQKEVSKCACPFWRLSLPTLEAHSAHWAAGLRLGCGWAAFELRLSCV